MNLEIVEKYMDFSNSQNEWISIQVLQNEWISLQHVMYGESQSEI